jgi:hypothetical protein
LVFVTSLDPLGQRRHTEFADQLHQTVDHPTSPVARLVDVLDQGDVELQVIGRHFDQLVQAGVSPAEIVVGQTDVELPR